MTNTNTDATVASSTPEEDEEALAQVWDALAATDDDRRWDALRDWLNRA